MKLSSFVMLSSRDVKLSSCAAAKLSLVVAVAELATVVVAVTQVISVVVAATKVVAVVAAATKVNALVVAAKEVAAVAVMNLNWKFQSLHCQTQCAACAIGHDSQRSFQVSIHHSL
jgi:hypothetical protein